MSKQKIESFILKNANGIRVEILNYGGIISSIKAPDRNGNLEDIVLGFDDKAAYLGEHPYFGALIGRFANRIANGVFSLDGKEYSLAQNNGTNQLHGGKVGFDKVFWEATPFNDNNVEGLTLSYLSKDMEEGYPGNVFVRVTYSLTEDNTLKVAYHATTDKKTIINLTQHSYFNLSGDSSTAVLDHELQIEAAEFLPLNENQIPLGMSKSVANSPFDFRTAKSIGRDIENENEQLAVGNGYDHCWILANNGELSKFAEVYHPKSGRLMEVFTTEPGVQLYTGNFLNGSIPSKSGGTYGKRSGFCLETQHFPDSPNQPNFPSTILMPEQAFSSETWFRFSTKNN